MSEATISGRFAVKQVLISENTIATNEIVAAVVDANGNPRSIRVISLIVVVGGAAILTFQSASTPITGAMSLAANGGLAVDSETGLFWTNPGEALNLTSTTTAQVSGVLTYVEE